MNIITFKSFIPYCLTITLSLLLVGCAPRYVEFPITSPTRSDGIRKIPLRAGLYMSNSFKELTQIMYVVDYTSVFGRFGPAFAKGAESMAKEAFEDVVILDHPEQAAVKKTNILIIPEIDFIGFDYTASTATIKIKWSIKDIGGKVLYLNTFIGEGDGKGTSIRYPTKLANACTRAIEDHFRKALDGILKTRWWEDIATNY